VKNWDHTAGPNVKEGQRRVPDIICTDPYSKTVYIIASPPIYLHLAVATVSTTRKSWRRRQRISSARTGWDGVTA
jgi:hypothetical protein